ncbi:hypothetical protein [Neobacillus sp. D3-1R]|uniref:hypothetical protein n=1 Tax=Neobacillus sp. D3-1R TaxID=3445778 RepID=UPI003F9F1317
MEFKIKRIGFKSVFTFLLIVCLTNVVLTSPLTMLGLSTDASLFICTSFSAAIAITVCAFYVEKLLKSKKQMITCFLLSLAACSIGTYFLIFFN